MVIVLRLISLASARAPKTSGNRVAKFIALVSASEDSDSSWSLTLLTSRASVMSPATSVNASADSQAQPSASPTAGMSSAHHSLVVRILRNSALISRPIRRYLRSRPGRAAAAVPVPAAAVPPAAAPAAVRSAGPSPPAGCPAAEAARVAAGSAVPSRPGRAGRCVPGLLLLVALLGIALLRRVLLLGRLVAGLGLEALRRHLVAGLLGRLLVTGLLVAPAAAARAGRNHRPAGRGP